MVIITKSTWKSIWLLIFPPWFWRPSVWVIYARYKVISYCQFRSLFLRKTSADLLSFRATPATWGSPAFSSDNLTSQLSNIRARTVFTSVTAKNRPGLFFPHGTDNESEFKKYEWYLPCSVADTKGHICQVQRGHLPFWGIHINKAETLELVRVWVDTLEIRQNNR